MPGTDVEIVHRLKQILGKFERERGIVIWGVDATGAPQEVLVEPDGTVHVQAVIVGPPGAVDVTDRAARLLGIVYGSQGAQLLQRAATFDTLVQLRSAGVEIDPRAIRALTVADQISVQPIAGATWDVSDRAARLLGITYGSQGAQLLQRAATNDLIVQLRSAGAEIDPRDVIDRAARLVGIVYGDTGQLLQDAARRLKVTGDVAAPVPVGDAGGSLTIDGTATVTQAAKDRTISDVTKVPTPAYRAPVALGAGGTTTIWTPAAGKKIRLKRIQVSVDAATRVDLRWAAAAFESYYLPANGSVVVNFIATNYEGGVDEALTLLSSAAATVTASAHGDEI